MSRKTSAPTAAAPWLSHWDTVDMDLASVDVNQAPVELVIPQDADGVTIVPGRSVAAPTAEGQLHLLYARPARGASATGAENPRIYFVADFLISAPTTARRMDADNGGQPFLKDAVRIDLRGVTRAPQGRWYLALAALGDAAETVYLIDYSTYSRRPS